VLFVDCEAAFYRTSVPRAVAQILRLAGYEFGLMREQWCCGGPAAEMGYVEQAKRFARHNLDDWRAVGVKRVIVLDPHDYIAFTRTIPSTSARNTTTSRSCSLWSSSPTSSAKAA
jgi:heterodisulfide reductase subunit D